MLTIVVIFYLGLSLLVGVFLSRRVKKTSDFHIADRIQQPIMRKALCWDGCWT